jgi:hypothetical protein
LTICREDWQQGDQIGRIFDHWLIIHFGQLLENHKSSPHFWATFFYGNGYLLIFTIDGLGHVLGDFCSNSSGHPDFVATRFGDKPISVITASPAADSAIDALIGFR